MDAEWINRIHVIHSDPFDPPNICGGASLVSGWTSRVRAWYVGPRMPCRTLGLLALLVGCAAASQQVTALPVIDTVTPASGPAGTAYPIEITISGRNFTDTANVVTFGPVRMERVRSEA